MRVEGNTHFVADMRHLLATQRLNLVCRHSLGHKVANAGGVALFAIGVRGNREGFARLRHVVLLDKVGVASERRCNVFLVKRDDGGCKGGVVTATGGAKKDAVLTD